MAAQVSLADSLREFLRKLLEPRLSEKGSDFWAKARNEVSTSVSSQRFAALLATASRFAKRQPLALTAEEEQCVAELRPGWSPAGWNQLELLRVNLLLARADLHEPSFTRDYEQLFQFADEGETCALYRALPLLPEGERFVWRAAEACRTNMLTVFEAVALDSPYPVEQFDDTAWHQLVIKALFLDCPLYRIAGLDQRLTPELTRMALDWAEERDSAGRSLYMGLWLCLGPHHSDRVRSLLDLHWSRATTAERQAMALAAGRAEQHGWLASLQGKELETSVQRYLQYAVEGRYRQADFAFLQ